MNSKICIGGNKRFCPNSRIKIFIVFFIASFLFIEVRAQDISVKELKDQYGKIFETEVVGPPDDPYPVVFVKKKPDVSNNSLSLFTQKMSFTIVYLQSNYSEVDMYKANSLAKDTIALKEYVVSTLKDDTVFNKYFFPFVGHFLDKYKFTLKGYELEKPITISIDNMMDILSKFYYAFNINPKSNNINWKVCVGGNEWFNPASPHYDPSNIDSELPILEAYAFQIAILSTREKNIIQEFHEKSFEITKEFSSIQNEQKRLERSRKAMYDFMYNNKGLKNFLLTNYEEDKESLPFKLNPNLGGY